MLVPWAISSSTSTSSASVWGASSTGISGHSSSRRQHQQPGHREHPPLVGQRQAQQPAVPAFQPGDEPEPGVQRPGAGGAGLAQHARRQHRHHREAHHQRAALAEHHHQGQRLEQRAAGRLHEHQGQEHHAGGEGGGQHRPATSEAPTAAASSGLQPFSSRLRTMFSRTTMALSTIMPTPSARPPKVIWFRVRPPKYSSAKQAMIETGIDTADDGGAGYAAQEQVQDQHAPAATPSRRSARRCRSTAG